MAIAGKVSIVPKGEWQSTEVYTRLDLVTFNYNTYLALKESIGIEPTNEEYFMLLIENVVAGNLEYLQNQIDDIILGEISAGNSENSNNLNNQPPTYYATAQSVADIISGTTPVAKAEDSNLLQGFAAEAFVLLENAQKHGLFQALSKRWDELEKTPQLVATFFTGWAEGTDLPSQYGSGIILPTLDYNRKFILYIAQESNLPKTIYIGYMTFSDETTYTIDWKDIRNDIDAKTLNGLKAEEFVNNGNMLLDPNFELYRDGIKKWKFTQGSGTVESTENGIIVTANVNDIQFSQHTESLYFPVDSYITSSLEFDNATDLSNTHLVIYIDNTWIAQKPFATANNNIITNKLMVSKGMHTVGLGIYMTGVGNKVTINWAKLEPGHIATSFIPPNKEVEKLKCGATEFIEAKGDFFVAGETILSWATNPKGVYKKFVVDRNGYPDDVPRKIEGFVTLDIDQDTTRRSVIYRTFSITGYQQQWMRSIYNNSWYSEWENISDGGNAASLGNETAEQWKNKLDEIQSTSRGNLSQAGWYRVAEYTGDILALKGAYSNSCDITINMMAYNSIGATYKLRLSSIANNQEFLLLDSKSSDQNQQGVTKIRYTFDATKAYLEVYYVQNSENPIRFIVDSCIDAMKQLNYWKAITPTLTSETLEGVTVTATYDIPANASPVTDLDLKNFDADTIDGIDSYALMKNTNDNPTDFSITQSARIINGDARFPTNYGSYVAFRSGDTSARGSYILHLYADASQKRFWYQVTESGANAEPKLENWNEITRKEDLTTTLAGYLPLSGGKMTGNQIWLSNGKALVENGSSNNVNLAVYNTDENWSNGRYIRLYASNAVGSIIECLQLVDKIDNATKYYAILHTGNKPTGSYTGNGSATARTINVGGIGSVLCIRNGTYIGFIWSYGAVIFRSEDDIVIRLKSSEIKFQDGILTLSTTNSVVNGSGTAVAYSNI